MLKTHDWWLLLVFKLHNSKGNIIGVGNVGKNYCTTIENVCLVDNLKHNLFSISQLCDKSSKVIFDKSKWVIENASGETLFVCASSHDKCFSTLHDDGWLWYRRVGYKSMYLILKISKKLFS